MIRELRISGLGVIDESVLSLGPGYTVITGETGAGKTMLITALGLLLGGRADSGVVRESAAMARVEGTVEVDSAVAELIDEHGGVVEDGAVLLNRQVTSQGRSRAFLGGSSVPAAVLGELSKSLVAIHGQTDQLRLLKPGVALNALDSYGGSSIEEMRAQFREDFLRLKVVQRSLEEEQANSRAQALELEMLKHGVEEIAAVDPRIGEAEELANEESRLGAADTLRVVSSAARETLSSDSDGNDAVSHLVFAAKEMERAAELDAAASELSKRAAELSYLVSDLASDVASYAENVEVDPIRLAAVSERRAAITNLTRKYGEGIPEILEWAEEAASRINRIDGSDERIGALREERKQLRIRMSSTAAALTEARSKLAEELSVAVTEEIRALSMPHARLTFEVGRREVEDDDKSALALPDGNFTFTETGVDHVEIIFAGHQGGSPRPLQKGASGGELSRVMLGLEVVLAGSDPTPTMIFDEVDAGVGGKAAVEIGRRLAVLASSTQVLVVTHLPQVAAFADSHVVVRKSSDGSVTTSGLEQLDDAGRVKELSRMLAGLEDSETAQAHAEELLQVAKDARFRKKPRRVRSTN
jgi:DNA repair protein RecN (Recombination protein N)